MDERDFWEHLGIDMDAEMASNEEKAGMKYLEEDEVSIERLQELFDAAYMDCGLDDDGDLRIATDAGPRVFVSLHEGAKMVRMMALYRLRDDVLEDEKFRLVNRMNDDMILVRFSVSDGEMLVADYYLPYTRGVSAFQIINTVKLMGRIVVSALRQHDVDNYVE